MDYGDETYGDRIAEVYDNFYPWLRTDEAVEFLAELVEEGPVLELGPGTGRIALPLVERGVEVHGIDASPRMLEQLRAKPRGDEVQVTLGDFSLCQVEGEFALIFVVFGTFYALTDQERQVACFHNVAKKLKPGGRFVVEAFVPDLERFNKSQTFRTTRVEAERVFLEAAQHDPLQQTVTAQQIVMSEEGNKFYPVMVRYVWPSEFDLMGRLAGLELVERWGDWKQTPFTESSRTHVSVWRKPT